MSTFLLTPRRIPAGRKASTAKREVDQDMVAKEESVSEVGSDADSGWSGVRQLLHGLGMYGYSSIASDQNRFDTAYQAFQDLANDLYCIDLTRYSRGSTSKDAAGVLLLDGYEKLPEMAHLPRTWPLARLTIPLEGLNNKLKVICKENKEQKGKQKYHAGTSHPNDRGGFPQWFGSCSLMTTLYVWFSSRLGADGC